MKPEIRNFLDELPSDFDIVKEQVDRYHSFDRKAGVRPDGAIRVFNRTWVAPMNFGFVLFPPISQGQIERYELKEDIRIPEIYKAVLVSMNGCFIYDFSLFGIPVSVLEEGLIDRSDLYQWDVGTANRHWIHEYKVDNGLFYFGSRAYSSDENTGYFFDAEGRIHSVLISGQVVKTWDAFNQFMADEVLEAEKMMRIDLPPELRNR